MEWVVDYLATIKTHKKDNNHFLETQEMNKIHKMINFSSIRTNLMVFLEIMMDKT